MKAGTQLVCIAEGWYKPEKNWFGRIKKIPMNGPKKDEIVTFHSYAEVPGYIYIEEYLNLGHYEEKGFVPLISNSELQKELSSITVSSTAYR